MLERPSLTLKEEVEHFSERQEVLTDLMVSKKDMQNTAPEKYQGWRNREQKKPWHSYTGSTS